MHSHPPPPPDVTPEANLSCVAAVRTWPEAGPRPVALRAGRVAPGPGEAAVTRLVGGAAGAGHAVGCAGRPDSAVRRGRTAGDRGANCAVEPRSGVGRVAPAQRRPGGAPAADTRTPGGQLAALGTVGRCGHGAVVRLVSGGGTVSAGCSTRPLPDRGRRRRRLRGRHDRRVEAGRARYRPLRGGQTTWMPTSPPRMCFGRGWRRPRPSFGQPESC